MPKLSVIVPVYNADKYLKRCIDSILNQSFSDLELILVNDGSTDNSGVICDEYVQKDSRVRVIHKDNEGVSAARNDGIESADGEYIAFVDSDDWIEPDMYSDMISIFDKYNVDFVRSNRFYTGWPDREDGIPTDQPDRQLREGLYSRDDIKKEIFNRLFVTDNLNMGPICSTFLTIYNKVFLNRNCIRYHPEIKINEDLLFSAKVVYCTNSFYYSEKAYYHWFYNPSSVSRTFNKGIFDSLKKTCFALNEYFSSATDYDFSEQLERYALFAILVALSQRNNLSSFKEKYRYCNTILKDRIVKCFSLKTIKNLKISNLNKLEIILIKLRISLVFAIV